VTTGKIQRPVLINKSSCTAAFLRASPVTK
jgi:hypothetical protein